MSARRSYTQVGMNIDKAAKVNVRLRIWDFPGEAAQSHAKEDHGDSPHIRFLRIVRLTAENFGCQVRVGTNDARSLCRSLSRIVEDGCSAKIDEFDDVLLCHDTIVQLEITMGQTHAV